MDEPSSGLNDKESEELMELLQSLIAEGFTILLIEHDMNVVMGVSDWIAVMDMGSKIAEVYQTTYTIIQWLLKLTWVRRKSRVEQLLAIQNLKFPTEQFKP